MTKVSKSRTPKIDFTPKKNSRGTETTFHTAFSAGKWNVKTLQYLKTIKLLSAKEMRSIMDLSQDLTKANDNRTAELEENDDDPRGHLRGRTFNDSEIESVCSDDEDVPGWGSICDAGGSKQAQASGSSSKASKEKVLRS